MNFQEQSLKLAYILKSARSPEDVSNHHHYQDTFKFVGQRTGRKFRTRTSDDVTAPQIRLLLRVPKKLSELVQRG